MTITLIKTTVTATYSTRRYWVLTGFCWLHFYSFLSSMSSSSVTCKPPSNCIILYGCLSSGNVVTSVKALPWHASCYQLSINPTLLKKYLQLSFHHEHHIQITQMYFTCYGQPFISVWRPTCQSWLFLLYLFTWIFKKIKVNRSNRSYPSSWIAGTLVAQLITIIKWYNNYEAWLTVNSLKTLSSTQAAVESE